MGYNFVDTKNKFNLSSKDPFSGLPGINFNSRSVALSLMLNYDSRDNMFTPSKGIAAELKLMDFNELWGSDKNFKKYSASFISYTGLNDKPKGDSDVIYSKGLGVLRYLITSKLGLQVGLDVAGPDDTAVIFNLSVHGL